MQLFKTGIVIATGLLFIGALSFAPNNKQKIATINNCDHITQTTLTKNTTNACLKLEEDTSWFSWFSGNSRSAQFHYLDLLELLTSSSDSKNAPSLKPLF